MDCKQFRENHSLYLDLRCSALEESEMREHLSVCSDCSRHDTRIRRSLLLVRNLPPVEVSPDFRARLDARLAMVRPFSGIAPRSSRPLIPMFLAAAASIVFLAYMARSLNRAANSEPVTLPPVVASLPESDPSPVTSPALVLSVPTGMSVWPAIMVASQAPAHFVTAEMASER